MIAISSITGNWDRRISRRKFLSSGGVGAVALLLGAEEPKKGAVLTAPTFPDYPFKLGIASGDPLPEGIVLWTRLAPDPLLGGGMPQRNVKVRWEVASDEDFSQIVQSGTATAKPEFAHSVHVEVGELEPGRYYWYRFKSGDEISATGRTRTASALGYELNAMAFAFASCQYWEDGYYPAYRAMAEEDLDLVIHLGDYIYEWGPMSGGPRTHETPAPVTLDGYRSRYALYKTDSDLQAAHAAHPWMITWDDHEGYNSYADLLDVDSDRPPRPSSTGRPPTGPTTSTCP